MIALQHVTVDCRDATALAAFWSAALDRPVDDGASEHFASIGIRFRSRQPAWLFIHVPEAKTAKNRMHVDFGTADRSTEVERLVALGASTHGEHDEFGVRWTVLADPEGNEFCVGGASPS
ncbi:MAG: VOC family protein [Geodermatophilaceae bacterium]|nr:VOC family protein [Geodermatophilaceae bacterium]